MPVLFQFPRSTRSSKARPLRSAMRKSGSKSIRRRIKTVHFASTKTLLSAPRTPPTLPLIPYDAHSPQSRYPRSMHTPNESYDSGTTTASHGGPYTPNSPSPYHQNANRLPPDLLAYYQPSSSTLKPLPHGVQPKVVHAETVPLDVEWDCAWEGEPEHGGRVVKWGRKKIPREKLPKTPHPKKAIDLQMPGWSPSAGTGESSYFPSGYAVSESGHEDRGRERSRRREMLDRLTGRSRSRSQQREGHAPAPVPSHQMYAQTQQRNGTGLLQVPQRQRHGSLSSSGSGSQIQLSSSAPSASYMYADGKGQLHMNYVYPPPANMSSSPSGHSRSRTSSFNTPYPQAPLAPQPSQHQQTHHRHHSAMDYSYFAPPQTVRRRSNSNPPETRHAYGPGSSHSPTTLTSQNPGHGGAYIYNGAPNTPQVQSASPYLSVPSRERERTSSSGRKRTNSLSYGAPPPSPHPSTTGSVRLMASHAAPQPQPQTLRRRTASNPHLSSGDHHSQGRHQLHAHRHTKSTGMALHRYLAVSSSSQPQISWDMRLPPATATRMRVARGASAAKVHYLSPQALMEPATNPPSGSMRVSMTRMHGSSMTQGWPWPVAIYPQDGSSKTVTLNDVLGALHIALRARASEKDYEKLLPDKMDKMAVSSAYEGRWREESKAELRGSGAGKGYNHRGGGRSDDEKAGVGLRRVDFLRGRTVFVGLEHVSGVEGEWCLVVR